jgi:hypothetical protein
VKKEYKQYPDISPVPGNYSRAVKAGDLFLLLDARQAEAKRRTAHYPTICVRL